VVAAVLALASSRCERSAERAPAPPIEASLAVAGCAFVSRTHCEVTAASRTLTLWVDTPTDVAATVRFGGAAVEAKRREVDGGVQLAVTLPDVPGEAPLQLLLTRGARSRTIEQPVRSVAPPAAYDRAIEARKAGRLDEALALLDQLDAEGEAWHARADSLRARIAMMRGDNDTAVAGFRRAIVAHHAAGRAADELRDATALSYLLTHTGRLAESALVLATAQPALQLWAEGRAQHLYMEALLATKHGDIARALHGLDATVQQAERLALDGLADDARMVLADNLPAIGRYDVATERVAGVLERATAKDCRRAILLNNLSWLALQQSERDHRPLGADVARQLDEALAIFADACPNPAQATSARINRALVAIHAGDEERATELLATVTGRLQSEELSWVVDMRSRLAATDAERNTSLAAIAAADEVARQAVDDDARWRLAMARGRLLTRLGKLDDALATWREAEEILDAATASVPLGEGRATFLASRDASAAALVERLVELGRHGEALAAARRARARALASAQRLGRIEGLDAEARAQFQRYMERYQRARADLADALEDRWALPSDALAGHDRAIEALRAQSQQAVALAFEALGETAWTGGPARRSAELLLALFPRPRVAADGWWCFAEDDGGVTAHAVPLPHGASDEQIASALLAPLTDRVKKATSLRILAHGRWQAIDVHALPFEGRPLLATSMVRYGVDVPGAVDATQQAAAVVADPGGDLPHAREEGHVVSTALASRSVAVFEGRAATQGAVSHALQTVGLLHFAGHGRLAEHRLASQLELAERDAITVGDVLALDRVPGQVILSGCATARTHDDAGVADLSLATAFVVAGASEVVATVRPVRDSAGVALARRVYAHAQRKDWSLGDALRDAQLALAEGHDTDWSAYRLITP
jgi:predicted negative regulator of RcsB-dependent stress response